MRRLALTALTVVVLVAGTMTMSAAPASATVFCGSNTNTFIRKPEYMGSGQWRTRIECTLPARGDTAWRTNMGQGGDITNLQLCSVISGTCVRSWCWSAAGGPVCQVYVDGGQYLRGRVQRNGVTYWSPGIYM